MWVDLYRILKSFIFEFFMSFTKIDIRTYTILICRYIAFYRCLKTSIYRDSSCIGCGCDCGRGYFPFIRWIEINSTKIMNEIVLAEQRIRWLYPVWILTFFHTFSLHTFDSTVACVKCEYCLLYMQTHCASTMLEETKNSEQNLIWIFCGFFGVQGIQNFTHLVMVGFTAHANDLLSSSDYAGFTRIVIVCSGKRKKSTKWAWQDRLRSFSVVAVKNLHY